MPRELYNEGRVVGYSAYEMYLRHHLGIDPDHSPASEKEWLASMMAMGSSMLLRIGADTTEGTHYVEIEFPKESRLCAANNIIASYFSGAGYVESDPDGNGTGWATKVIDYGPLIANSDSTFSPKSDNDIPMGNVGGELTDVMIKQIREYMKIIDGIVIQSGTWTTNINKPPYKDFTPTLSKAPKLRLSFSDKIDTPFYILLTGFTNRTVVDGQTGFDSAVNTKSPADGDFLGPWAFPWAAKIFFHVPSSFVSYFMSNNYSRELPSGSADTRVDSDSIIDMATTNPGDYYSATDYFKDAAVDVKVTELYTFGKDAAVLAAFRNPAGNTQLPPALYGAVVGKTGSTKYNPMDTVAPGTVKLYHIDEKSLTEKKAQELVAHLESNTPYNYGFYRDETSYVIYEYDSRESSKEAGIDYIPVSDDETINVNGLQTYNTKYVWLFEHSSGFSYKLTEQGNPTNPTGTSCDGCASYDSEQQVCKRNKNYKRNTYGECINSNGAGGSSAWFEFKDVRSFVVGEVRSGQFSPEFISKYGIPLSDARNTYKPKLDNSCFCQVYGTYWSEISDEEANKYSVIFTGSSYYKHSDEPGKTGRAQLSFIVVRNEDGAVAEMAWGGGSIQGMTGSLDFTHGTSATITNNGTDPSRSANPGSEENPYSEAYVTQQVSSSFGSQYYDKSVTRYLGYYWGNYCDSSCPEHIKSSCKWRGKCSCQKDYGGNVVYNGHKAIKEVAPYTGFYMPNAGIPDTSGWSFETGDVEDRDFIDWEYSTPITDLLAATGQLKADGTTDLNIHTDYLGLSIGEFLQKAVMRNLSKPDEPTNNISKTRKTELYVYSKDEIEKYCSAYDRLNGSTDYPELRASVKITIPGTSDDFFTSRMWKLEEMEITATGTVTVIKKDITESANRSNSAIYAAQGTSGHHTSKAISVVDVEGQILQFAGTGAIISTDYITWLDLLDALDHNKRIDLLGDVLRGLKVNLTDSGNNYLEFANGLRVYFSKTEPTGDDIPDGSIGIGW